MKRITAALAALVCLILLTSCSGNPPLNNVPSDARPALDTAVVITRALGRVEIAKVMRSHGASDATVTSTLGVLHKGVDDLLAGKSIVEVVTDPAAWLQLREIGVKNLATVLTTAVPDIDQVTAELLIGQLFDAAKAYVLQRVGSAVSPTTNASRSIASTGVTAPYAVSAAWCQQDDQCRITLHEEGARAFAYCANITPSPMALYRSECAKRYNHASIELGHVQGEIATARLPLWLKRQWIDSIRTSSDGYRTMAAYIRDAALAEPSVSTPPPPPPPLIDRAMVDSATVSIGAELRHYASAEVATAALNDLRAGFVSLLDGKSIAEVIADPEAWQRVRRAGVFSLSTIISTAVPQIGQATAEIRIGQMFDTLESLAIKGRAVACTVTIPAAARERGLKLLWHDYYADGAGHTTRVEIAADPEWAPCPPDGNRVVWCRRNSIDLTEWNVSVPTRLDGRYHFSADDIFGNQFTIVSDCKGGSL